MQNKKEAAPEETDFIWGSFFKHGRSK